MSLVGDKGDGKRLDRLLTTGAQHVLVGSVSSRCESGSIFLLSFI